MYFMQTFYSWLFQSNNIFIYKTVFFDLFSIIFMRIFTFIGLSFDESKQIQEDSALGFPWGDYFAPSSSSTVISIYKNLLHNHYFSHIFFFSGVTMTWQDSACQDNSKPTPYEFCNAIVKNWAFGFVCVCVCVCVCNWYPGCAVWTDYEVVEFQHQSGTMLGTTIQDLQC